MRRDEREVKNKDEIIDILRRADTIRLGLNSDSHPYVVPLSFGLDASGGVVKIYFHGAKEGYKHDLIQKDGRCCVEADIFHRYTENEMSVYYESFIGFGTVTIINGEEAVKGIELLLEHCGYAGFEYDHEYLNEKTEVFKITLDSFTGKRQLE